MTNITLRAPTGGGNVVQTPAGNYSVAADGSVSVDSAMVPILLAAGFTFWQSKTGRASWLAPAAADLISISNAAAMTVNGARVVAAQPDYARKLQVRLVKTSGTITAGVLTLVGTDVSGAAITEDIALATAASLTQKTVNAYSHLTSATVSALAGTFSYTLGIGVAADLALPIPAGFKDLTVNHETAASSTTDTWTVAAETVGTVDTTAGTLAPSTAPDGAHHFVADYSFSG